MYLILLWLSYDVGLIGLFSWILICGCKSMQYVIWNTVNISVHCHNITKLNLCTYILEDEKLINSQNSLVLDFHCILYFSVGFMATVRPNYIDSEFYTVSTHEFAMIIRANCKYFSTPRWLVDICERISVILVKDQLDAQFYFLICLFQSSYKRVRKRNCASRGLK
jgi:hypothetical protein